MAQETGEDDIFSEEDLFGSVETVVDVEEQTDDSILEEVTGESVGFSGEMSANFGYLITRDYLDDQADFADNPYSTSIESDLLLDVRLQKGIKAFADLWGSYSPQKDESNPDDEYLHTTLKEFFVDVNVKHRVYFRFGKQNLIWGRGYLWNPTDVISEDRKDFNDMDARREGVYGLKMHIPFGTTWNIYGFVNASGADKTDEFAVAGKVEVLMLDDIEMALSVWKKKDYEAVYGFDFATNKWSTDWRGEISLSNGDNRRRLEKKDGEYSDTEVTDEWIPRFCLGFTRGFDFRDITDRISLTGEFYYNYGGYVDDMLGNDAIRDRFLEEGYFERGNYGKYYVALFSSYNKFLISDMTLEMQAIANLSDSSFIVSSGVDYELATNAVLCFSLEGYLGKRYREYTFEGNALNAEIAVSLAF
jgi:hypothetical protein